MRLIARAWLIIVGAPGLTLGALTACESPPQPLPPIVVPNPNGASPTPPGPAPAVITSTPDDPSPALEHATAESAKIQTADWSPVADLRIQQEILLHAAMYRAAIESSVGDTGRFVLEPVQEQQPPDLGADPVEFRLRVLAALADIGRPVAWVPITWRTPEMDTFPGIGEKATRLTIAIHSRDEQQATVHGEIGDRTAGARSSRQKVMATWDGLQWIIERDRVRVVW